MIRHFTHTATLVKDDERTGYKKGKKFDPLGFYYSPDLERVILVGSVKEKHSGRISFPISSIKLGLSCK